MDKNTRILLYFSLSLILIFSLYYLLTRNTHEKFSKKDKEFAEKALKDLEISLKKGGHDIEVVSDKMLNTLADDIYLARMPKEYKTEKLSYFPTANTRYWPYYYYSFPYNYKYGGAWPPGMFSRLYYWSPGFYTGSSWSHYLRPGMGFKYWPRNRWIRHTSGGKDSYYYVKNRDDYIHNAANYAGPEFGVF